MSSPDPAAPRGVALADAETGADHDHTALAEDLRVPERLIAAPAAGVFNVLVPDALMGAGVTVRSGESLGSIERNAGTVPVVSPHTGFLMGLLALPGERVRDGQPVAWVRVTT